MSFGLWNMYGSGKESLDGIPIPAHGGDAGSESEHVPPAARRRGIGSPARNGVIGDGRPTLQNDGRPEPVLHLKTLGPAFRATNSIPTGIFIRVFCCRESVRLALTATNWDRFCSRGKRLKDTAVAARWL